MKKYKKNENGELQLDYECQCCGNSCEYAPTFKEEIEALREKQEELVNSLVDIDSEEESREAFEEYDILLEGALRMCEALLTNPQG